MKGRAAGAKEHICGDAFYNLGRLKEARSAYLRALRILSDDPRIASKLGLTEIRLGLKKNGLARLIKALKTNPEILEVHDWMVKAYILMNMMPQAAEAAERLAMRCANPATILRAASIRGQMKDWKAAENLILRGLQFYPQSQELLRARKELEWETTPSAQQPRECGGDAVVGAAQLP